MAEVTVQDGVTEKQIGGAPLIDGSFSGAGGGLGPIDRVLDVPLDVTLRFGQRQMRLHDVLELTTGSLVELDRQVDEPVELVLGQRVIARGEVVIVDGSYGLRVTEVPLSAAGVPVGR